MKWLVLLFLTTEVVSADIHVLSVAASSDFTSGLPAAGSLASIFVSGLTGIRGVVQANGYPLPYSLDGTSVTVYGAPAPIVAVADLGGSYEQINIQVPVALDFKLPIQVTQSGVSGEMTAFAPVGGPWGVFFALAKGQGVLQHADYSLVTDANPSKPGEVLVAYGTNLAGYESVSNAPPIGEAARADPLPKIDIPGIWNLQVQVNGQQTPWLYMGLTPESAGVFQVNFVVPASLGPGVATLEVLGIPYCYGFGSFCPDVKRSNRVTFPMGAAN
jgi:uncharacterized protein (TIGR03437 family)